METLHTFFIFLYELLSQIICSNNIKENESKGFSIWVKEVKRMYTGDLTILPPVEYRRELEKGMAWEVAGCGVILFAVFIPLEHPQSSSVSWLSTSSA